MALRTWIWAFNLRIFFLAAISLILIGHYGIPFVGFHDDYFYDQMAQMARVHSLSDFASLRHPGYPWFLALLAKLCNSLGGYHYLSPRIINAAIGAALAAGVVQTARALRPAGSSLKLLSLVCIVLPDYLYYSSLTLRDIIIAYLWLLAMIGVLSNRPLAMRLAIASAGIIPLYSLRPSYAGLLGVLVVFAFVIRDVRVNLRPAQLALVFAVLFVALGLYLPRVQAGRWSTDNGVVGNLSQEVSSGIAIATRDEPLAARKRSGLQRVFDLLPLKVRPAFFSVFQFFSPVPFWRVGGDTTVFNWLFILNGLMWLLISSAGVVTLAGLVKRRTIPPEITILVMFGLVPVIASGITYGIVRYRLPGIGPILILVFCNAWRPRDRSRLVLFAAGLLAVSLLWEIVRYSIL